MSIVHYSDVEWKAIDKKVAELMREPITFDIMGSTNVGMGAYEFEFFQATDINKITHGQEYSYDKKNVPGRIRRTNKIDRITIPIHVSEQRIKTSGRAGITNLLASIEIEGSAQLKEEIEKTVYLGDATSLALGMTNFTGLNTSVAAGAWTTNLNFIADLETALSSLRSAHILPPYTLIMTPGIPGTLRANEVSAGAGYQTEWQTFLENYMNQGMLDKVAMPQLIDRVVFSDKIVNAALTTANQAFILFKNDINCCYVGLADAPHRKITPNKMFEGDVDYALCAGLCYIFKNPDAVYYVTGGATDSAY